MIGETDLLFVYGTLRQDADHPAHRLLEKETQFIGPAHMNGRLYEVDGYPGAVCSDSSTEQVLGELYQLLEVDSLLVTLDDYEEVGKNYSALQEYRRCRITVEREDKTRVIAWCYLYNRPTAGLRPIASGDWCE